jgi:GTP-binding protein
MSLTIAIVGRPNVGKSTLFNRLVGRRVALVDATPGVTRDRRESAARLGDLRFNIVDTAGVEEGKIESLSGRMRAQTEAAIVQADTIMFMVDARAGILPDDRTIAEMLRRSGKPTILIANKCEGRAAAAGALEAYDLGLGEPVSISAEHGEGLSELYDALREAMPDETALLEDLGDEDEEDVAPAPDRPIRIAVVGRPNVGKSTLINRLLGEERLITGAEAGLTRDSITVELAWRDHRFLVHDTAGLRRRYKIEGKLEKLSVADTLESIRFAEVVILLLDATATFEEQELRIADLVEREGRALVLGVNKWDLKEDGDPGAAAKLSGEADHWLPQVKGVPTVAVSGLTGSGLDRLMQAVLDIHAVWNKRVSTNPLNKWLAEVLSAHPPPAVSGRRLKLNYITQAKARPPSFVLFCTRADAVPEGYRRYLVNALRETFELPGVPIRLTLREKKNPYADRKVKR